MGQTAFKLKYNKAPKDKFEEIQNILQSKDNNLIIDIPVLCSIYEELQKKSIYITAFIAQGGQGMVFEAEINKQLIVVKLIKPKNLKDYQEELNVLEQMKGVPNTCQLIEEFQSEINTIYIQIFKRYQSDLKNVMQCLFKQKETFPLNSIVGIALNISQVLEQMKSKNMFHSDLKPLNILYDSVAKKFDLSDFGAAKQFESDVSHTKDCKALNGLYVSPEIYTTDVIRIQHDIYCFGLVLLEMTAGKFFTYEEFRQIRLNGVQNFLSSDQAYAELNQIITSMLIKGQKQRITPEELTKSLISLKNKLEKQFVDAVKTKVRNNKSARMIQEFKSDFVDFEFEFTQNETRMDSYYFEGINNLKCIEECCSSRLVHSLELDLEENNIGNQGAEKIAKALENCPNMTQLTLYLAENNIQVEGAKSIANALQQFTYITKYIIGLDNNNIGVDGTKSIAKALEKSPNITQLSLGVSQNNIGIKGAQSISKALEKSPNITQLNLSLEQNKIGIEGAQSISKALEKSPNITQLTLSLEQNNIGIEGAKSIAKALEKSPNITQLTLGLYNNNIGIEGAQSIAKALEKSPNITQLYLGLDQNNIGLEGTISISKALENHQNLTQLTLWLHSNNIGIEGAKSLSNALEKCPNITELQLYLWKNNISDEGAKSIIRALEKSPIITQLILGLGYNNLGIEVAQIISNTLEKSPNITLLVLDLSGNQIGLEGAKSIAKALENSPNITQLKLYLMDINLSVMEQNELRQRIENSKKGIQLLELVFQLNQ